MVDTVREKRVRRAAARNGVLINKMRGSDPDTRGSGTWRVYDPDDGTVLHGLTLDQVESFLAIGQTAEPVC